MRKLMALFAIVLVSTGRPSWAALGMGDITFDGSLEISGNSASNEVDQGNDPDSTPKADGSGSSDDHRGRTATRVRLGMNAQVTDKVSGRIELGRDPRQYGTAATSISGEESLIRVQNAYVDIAEIFGEGHLLRVGRQYVGKPGDLVWNISPTDDDNLTFNSIDGLLFECKRWDFMHASLFTGKAQENDTITGSTTDTDQGDGSATDSDINLSSIDFDFPTIIPGGSINLGFLDGMNSNAQGTFDNNHLQTLRAGVRGGISENRFTYRAEFFQNMGKLNNGDITATVPTTVTDEMDYEGNAIDVGVGFNSGDTSVGGFGLWFNWLMASGDDDVTDGSDDSFHDFSVVGLNTSDRLLGEIFGKSNVLGGGTPIGQGINSADATGSSPNGATQGQGLQVLNLGGQFKPKAWERSTFRLDFFTFARSEDSVTTGPSTTMNVGDDFGTEFDATYIYDHTSNVNMELGYAVLMPDDALTGLAAAGQSELQDEAITKWFARAKIKWGGEAQ